MEEKKGSSLFAAAQQIGKSLFLPIAVLPFAGILLGIGSSFTNETTIATYHLTNVLHDGTFLYSFFKLLSSAGNAVFGNLALIFALAVALGMAKKEKGVAVLSSGIFYIIMLTTINVCLQLNGSIVDGVVTDKVKDGAITTMLGIQTLQMGVFGGIIAGVIAAVLCNKFYKMQLPAALSFFAGTRFVPIICMVFGIITGAVLFIVWPFIQDGIYALGGLVQSAGYFGTFIYGLIERALIPFGLHHIFYMPFWQTGVGGSAVIDGELVMGAQNIFFAELASPTVTKFSDTARFLAGKYPFMMGGLPDGALAMYSCAHPEKRREAGSLLFSVALTSFLTGVTEPIEFTFLFLAPVLFGIHAVLAGISFTVCHILGICVGTTFSDGLIDLILYGILPGQAKSNWMTLIPVILVYFALYFIIFRTCILKMDLKTPGREADNEEMKMMTKADYQKATGVGVAGGAAAAAMADLSDTDKKSANILIGVGGSKNVTEIDCCATRLRLTLVDGTKIDQPLLKSTGASGVVVKGNAIQVIYGPSVTIVKSNFEEFVEKVRAGKIDEASLSAPAEPAPAPAPAAAPAPKAEAKDFTLGAHQNGTMMLLTEVDDEAFASLALGDGIAIEPSEGKLYAPCDATVDNIFETKHAIGLTTADGVEILLHIGINTVNLKGEHFETHVEEDQEVKKGDLLISFDMDAIKAAGYPLTTPMIICNTDDYQYMKPVATGQVTAGQDLLFIKG